MKFLNGRGCILGVLQISIIMCMVGSVMVCVLGLTFWSEGLSSGDTFAYYDGLNIVTVTEAQPLAYTVMSPTPTGVFRIEEPNSLIPAATFTPRLTFTPTPPPTSAVDAATALPTPLPKPSATATASPTSIPPTFTPIAVVTQEAVSTITAFEPQSMRLAIPTLQLDTSILLAPIEEQTWKVNHLEQAVGHLEGTAHAGANSNMVLAGHVTLPPDGRAGPFVNLKRLAPNDTVIVYNQGQAFTYQIDYLITVKSTDVHVTYPSSEPRLTLITCLNYDRVLGRYTDRLVAVGHLIDN